MVTVGEITVRLTGDKALDLFNADPGEEDRFKVQIEGDQVLCELDDVEYDFDGDTPVARLTLITPDGE